MKKSFYLFLVLLPLLLQGFDDPNNFSFNAEWLHWKAQEDNLFIGSFVDDFPNPEFKHVTAIEAGPSFEFTNGFRLSAAYQDLYSPWQYSLKFTHLPFHSASSRFVSQFNSEDHLQFFILNNRSFPIYTEFPAIADFFVKWSGSLSYADVDFARQIFTCGEAFLLAHFGFRALWMQQKLYTESLAAPTDTTFFKTAMKQHSQSYGVEAGLWGRCPLKYNFVLFAHVGASLLYSNFHLNQKNRGFSEEGGELLVTIEGGEKTTTATPTTDFMVGLQYTLCFEKVDLSLYAAWEQQLFFDFNRLNITGGNFSVQGLNLGLSLAF